MLPMENTELSSGTTALLSASDFSPAGPAALFTLNDGGASGALNVACEANALGDDCAGSDAVLFAVMLLGACVGRNGEERGLADWSVLVELVVAVPGAGYGG